MSGKRLTLKLTYILFGIFMLSPAFAEHNWPLDKIGLGEIEHRIYRDNDKHHDDNVTVIYGKRSVLGVQVRTDNGFEKPEMGVTNASEILYNEPADGTDPVPLRQVPTLYITDGPNPVVIDESISADNTTRGLVFPGNPNPITLGDWLAGGHSKLRLKILRNGTSQVKIKIRGLLPNSLFGIWQFNQMPGAPGPFGGIPNVFITDHKGNATMQRTLPFNMKEIVKRLAIVYHSDHRIYGGTPSLIDAFGGHDIHVQLEFDIQDE